MRGTRRDGGSAVAEFVMVLGLLLAVALGVFQLGLALYVRNTLQSAASEGARLGARADASPGEGASRTRELITATLSSSYAADVSAAQVRTSDGVAVLQVTVRAPAPVIGLVGPDHVLSVSSRAFEERQ